MKMAKIWVDDIRTAPEGYIWCRSVNEAKKVIRRLEEQGLPIELLDLDHDAGDFCGDGGDYIRLLDYLEETGRNYRCAVHSMNPVGVRQMLQIIRKNGWDRD
jgi:hypothetical protein